MGHRIGNIIGNPFDERIEKQINERQRLLGRKEKNSNVISLYNAKTAWVRLASSINIENDAKFAKDNILFGGTSTQKGGLRKGFNETYKYDPLLGFRPMPSIERVNIKTLTRGALKKAEINIKVFSIEDFEIIEQLYTRPGYSLLLEWGHTKYVKNSGIIVDFNTWDTKPFNQLFNPKRYVTKKSYSHSIYREGKSIPVLEDFDFYTPPSEIMFDSIREEVLNHDGNYGAFFGRIVNFNYSLKDGIYNIRVELISHGDVIESLKLGNSSMVHRGEINNRRRRRREEREEEIASFIRERNNNELDEFLFKVWANNASYAAYGEKQKHWVHLIDDEDFDTNLGVEIKVWEKEIRITSRRNDKFELHPIYLRFGDLLKFLEGSCNIFIDNKDKYLKYDLNEEENLCRLIPNLSEAFFPSHFNKSSPFSLYPREQSEQGRRFTRTFSLDWGVCVIKNLQHFHDDVIGRMEDFFSSKYEGWGKIMNIYLNIEFVSDVFHSLKGEEDNKVVLYEFLKKICSGINKSLGNVNSLRPHIDYENNTVKIIEENFADHPIMDKPHNSKFEIYGLGSFVYEPGFSVTLSKEFSTMVTIGAQAGNSNISHESTSFSNYNKGLTDRIYPKKEIDANIEEENHQEKLTQIINTLKYNFIELAHKIYPPQKTPQKPIPEDTSLIENLINTGRDFYDKLLLYETQFNEEKKSRVPFFIPYKLKLNMDGLSGMRIYERFGITNSSTRILPKAYRNKDDTPKMDFIVEGVDENIEGNKWTTEITGISVPLKSAE